jgi:hypothetical protein
MVALHELAAGHSECLRASSVSVRWVIHCGSLRNENGSCPQGPESVGGRSSVARRKGPNPALVAQKQTPSSREMNGSPARPLDDGHKDGSRAFTVAKRLPGPRVSVVRWTCRLFREPFPLVSPGFDVTTASRSIEPPTIDSRSAVAHQVTLTSSAEQRQRVSHGLG